MESLLKKRTLLVSVIFLSLFVVAKIQADGGKLAIDKVEGALSVMVLGSGGPVAAPTGRASAGYLIFIDGQPRILMDAGGGTYVRLAESGANIKDLDIVLLSHLHIDHTGDLSSMIKTLYFHNRGFNLANPGTFPPGRIAAIRIWGPDTNGIGFPAVLPAKEETAQYPSTFEYVDGHYNLDTGVQRYLNIFSRAISGGIFNVTATDVSPDWKSYTPETILDEGGLKIMAVGVKHGPVPSLAFRIDYAGKSIVYTGDTSSTSDTNLIKLAQGADLLIYDTAIMDNIPGPDDIVFIIHTTPTRIGQVAAQANAKKLLLSHITPITDPRQDEVKGLIRAAGYTGKIKVAKDLKVYNLAKDEDDD